MIFHSATSASSISAECLVVRLLYIAHIWRMEFAIGHFSVILLFSCSFVWQGASIKEWVGFIIIIIIVVIIIMIISDLTFKSMDILKTIQTNSNISWFSKCFVQLSKIKKCIIEHASPISMTILCLMV